MARHTRELLASSHIDAFCLLETRTKDSKAMLKMANRMGFRNRFVVDLIGLQGNFFSFGIKT